MKSKKVGRAPSRKRKRRGVHSINLIVDPSTLNKQLEGFDKDAIEIGLFTPYELLVAIKYFQSDFGPLMYAIKYLEKEVLIENLRGTKTEYDHRFYALNQQDQLAASHVHIKLVKFIEACISNPGKFLVRNKGFVDLFKNPFEGHRIINGLISQKIIDPHNHKWMSQSRKHDKAICVTLFRYLGYHNYIKVEMLNDRLFANVANSAFKFPITLRTFSRNRNKEDLVAKDYWEKFQFLGKSTS